MRGPKRVLALALLLAACDRASLPRVPQVEQATEAIQDGGDRYRAHRACTNAATSVDALITCMHEAGWEFVARGPGYPELDCWQARDRGELGRVVAHCFARGHERGAGPSAPVGWKIYRSEELGYELAYPPALELQAFSGGRSAELRDGATSDALVHLELWPGDSCPRERPGTSAKALGMERAAAVTQADGPDGSSYCGEPMTVRESVSTSGVPLYELRLTCFDEVIRRGKTARRRAGLKGPTFFADVSQPWRHRVLLLDPVGTGPRSGRGARRLDASVVREVLATLGTFPLPDPNVVCIEDAR